MLNAREIEKTLPADMDPAMRELFMSLLSNLDGMQGNQAVHMTKAIDAMKASCDSARTPMYRMVQSELMHFHFHLATLHIQGAAGALSAEAQAFEQCILELEEMARDVEADELFIQGLINRRNGTQTLH
jgi:hypothetical protein